MAKTVGLPIGIIALQMLHKKIGLTGVHLPITKRGVSKSFRRNKRFWY